MIKLIECVPNISEGRNLQLLKALTQIIERKKNVLLLHRDIGYDAHRTVFTMMGEMSAVFQVMEETYRFCQKNIDMQIHNGAHPRIGAVDVCPFIPVKNVTTRELVREVNKFAATIGQESQVPVYLYEASAKDKKRQKLEDIRKGEYEGLRQKLEMREWKPDYGPDTFIPKFGATVIGVRKFLIAYNINLSTKDVSQAKSIAGKIRTSGRIMKDSNGQNVRVSGDFREVKAIGWYMKKYGCAQISTNLTDFRVTNMSEVYEQCRHYAEGIGIEVCGSELIGLIPEEAILLAGAKYTKSKNKIIIIREAIRNLGLSAIIPFVPEKRILEWVYKQSKSSGDPGQCTNQKI